MRPPVTSIFLLFLTSISLAAGIANAAPQIDIDNDGLSDPLIVTIKSGSLLWSARTSKDRIVRPLSALGRNGDHLAPGVWRQGKGTERVVVTLDVTGALTWTLEDTESFSFGAAGRTFLSGADFDGSGLLDAASVEKRAGKLYWTILSDPFAASPSGGTPGSEIEFGADGDKPFFANVDGNNDWFGVVAKDASAILFRNPRSEEQLSISIDAKLLAGDPPFPLKQPSGPDRLAFVQTTGAVTTVTIYTSDGQKVNRGRVVMNGTPVVGDFIPDVPGEEIALQSKGFFYLYNHTKRKRTIEPLKSPVAVDAININAFGGLAADPGVSQCAELNPLDGAKTGFTWKPNSDTTYYAVAVMPGTLYGKVSKVEVFSPTGEFIKQLQFFGCGNPDPNGLRCNHKDFQFTGSDYKRTYGSITLKVSMKDGSCGSYLITNPARRTD